jgi:acyl carrier protein phosphodiesterase
MEQAFIGMSKRTSFKSNMENAVIILKEYYSEFEADFNAFFPLLESYSKEERVKMGYN